VIATPYFFWIAATMNVAASIAFVIFLRRVALQNRPRDFFAPARGKRIDGWLASATIWIVILSSSHLAHHW
jgi:hypothetical protein